ncbi:hypothetical protein MMC30_004600 [Trapelia coarctata]|nr:hypothetical protein [Trapelia coarctata]
MSSSNPLNMSESRAVQTPSVSRNIFPFRQLPLEIRVMIYILALDFSYALGLVEASARPPRWYFAGEGRVSFDWRTTPGILLLCRQITAEALEFLYSKPFVLHRGCTPHSILGCFSKPLLQNLRHITFDININRDIVADIQLGRLVYRGDWRNVMRLLGVVWDQRHSIRTITINISGDQSHCQTVRRSTVSQYLQGILLNLRGTWAIPTVTINNNVNFDGSIIDQRRTTTVLGWITQALRRRRSSYPFLNGALSRGFLTEERKFLLFPAFVRWWLLSETTFGSSASLTKSQPLPWFPYSHSVDFRTLGGMWALSGWRCLELWWLLGDSEEQAIITQVEGYWLNAMRFPYQRGW